MSSGFVHVFAPPDEGPLSDDAFVCSDDRPFHEDMRGTYVVIYHAECRAITINGERAYRCPCCSTDTLAISHALETKQ